MINRFVSILFPFVLRTVMIQMLGAGYLGLNSLFSAILQVLNLAELGFSEAIVYSMYKPIADNDRKKICEILNTFRKIYAVIGCVIFVVGIILMPFLKYFIKDSYPEGINIHILFFIYLINTSISYWLFAYKNSILVALQRNDIISKIDVSVKIILNVSQILILVLVQNYYLYLIVLPVCTLINNLYTSYVVDKRYPDYCCKGSLDKETRNAIVHNVVGLSVSKICQTTRNSLDSVFTSAYIGLVATAMYGNYYMIISAVTSILTIMPSSIASIIGNSIATETVEKNHKEMNRINFLYMWMSSWTTTCLFCLIQPFMVLWVGKDYLFDIKTVVLFCLYYYVLKLGDIRIIYLQGAGLYWQQRYRAIGETVANVALNWILARYFGVMGIIAATIISLLIFNYVLSTQIVYKYYFKGISSKSFYIQNFKYLAATIFSACITYKVTSIIQMDGIMGFFILTVICCILPNMIWIMLFCFSKEYNDSINWFLDVIKMEKLKKFLIYKRQIK